jgi:uncharacterized coiled-coil DUF342 family protein
MTNYRDPVDIGLTFLLECDDQKLAEIFHFFFKAVVIPDNLQTKPESLEFLQLMEEAPELRERIKAIRIALQQELEKKISEIKNEYHKFQEENTTAKKRIEELKRENDRLEKAIDEKTKEISVLTAHLNEKRKQIEKMLTAKKTG